MTLSKDASRDDDNPTDSGFAMFFLPGCSLSAAILDARRRATKPQARPDVDFRNGGIDPRYTGVTDETSPGAEIQLRLPLDRRDTFEREAFVVSDSNREAVRIVDAWPAWPNRTLALIGLEGVGKTHLARAWAEDAGAVVVEGGPIDLKRCGAGPVLLEDAERHASEVELFHLMNRVDPGAALLMTARKAPRLWSTALPDLRSRLNAVLAVDIAPPDDTVLEGVLVKLFRDRHIMAGDGLLAYLLRRIERSVPAAMAVVERLDEAAHAAGRGVTRNLAREILGGDDGPDTPID
jgi:chromosomal replication initiation ATPase DnaA